MMTVEASNSEVKDSREATEIWSGEMFKAALRLATRSEIDGRPIDDDARATYVQHAGRLFLESMPPNSKLHMWQLIYVYALVIQAKGS